MAHKPMKQLKEWHDAIGQPRYVELDDSGRQDEIALRMGLIAEEFAEVAMELGYDYDVTTPRAHPRGDLHALAKELADLLYVVYGTAQILDIPLEKVFAKVHKNNMTKVQEDGKVLRRHDGKVIKPPGYKPINVYDLF